MLFSPRSNFSNCFNSSVNAPPDTSNAIADQSVLCVLTVKFLNSFNPLNASSDRLPILQYSITSSRNSTNGLKLPALNELW